MKNTYICTRVFTSWRIFDFYHFGSDSPLVRQPIGPTAHWFDSPLVRQPIGPTTNFKLATYFAQRIATPNIERKWHK